MKQFKSKTAIRAQKCCRRSPNADGIGKEKLNPMDYYGGSMRGQGRRIKSTGRRWGKIAL